MVRRDPDAVLARFGLFIFDEAQLVGEPGRGLGAESLISYLHWRTVGSAHRIALLSAAIGNAGQVAGWIDANGPGQLHTSEWRGPRRLHAVFATTVDWESETREPAGSQTYPYRLSYPLTGQIQLRVADNRPPRRLRLTEPVGRISFQATAARRGPRDSQHTTPNYQTAAHLILALGHAGAVLVVTSTRDAARRMAEALAHLLDERADLAPLVDVVRTQLGPAHPLVATLRKGVAYHHAALPTDVLESLEDALKSDRISYLTCTSTLTEGVNLPVRTVVICETRYPGQPESAQISGARLVNALGRAGRAGRESEGWLVYVKSAAFTPQDFEMFRPQPDDLELRSQMVTAEALESLARFEEAVRASEDAVFRAEGRAAEFISFVWFVLAAEEELSGAASAESVDSALRSTLAFRQLPADLQDRWVAVSHQVVRAYSAAGQRRRAWSKTGTSIGSARRIDGLAGEIMLSVGASTHGTSESVQGALQILDELRVIELLLALPESPAEVRFRATRGWRSTRISVDLDDLLHRWISGEELSAIAEDVLSEVSDPSWRIEQLVDAVTGHFEHYLAWTVGAVVELVNARLDEAGSTRRLCPQLGSFIRYGVSTEPALALMFGGVRSRRLAGAVASGWQQEAANESVREWLRSMSLPEWRDRFSATASEMLDLLDVARVRRRSLVRTLLEAGSVEVPVEAVVHADALVAMIAGAHDAGALGADTARLPVTLAAVASDPTPQRFGLHSDVGALLAVIPAAFHGDVDAILNTGIGVSSFLTATPSGVLARVQLDIA